MIRRTNIKVKGNSKRNPKTLVAVHTHTHTHGVLSFSK